VVCGWWLAFGGLAGEASLPELGFMAWAQCSGINRLGLVDWAQVSGLTGLGSVLLDHWTGLTGHGSLVWAQGSEAWLRWPGKMVSDLILSLVAGGSRTALVLTRLSGGACGKAQGCARKGVKVFESTECNSAIEKGGAGEVKPLLYRSLCRWFHLREAF